MTLINIKFSRKKHNNKYTLFFFLPLVILICFSLSSASDSSMDNNQEPEKELSLESIDKSLSSLKGTIDNITNTQINELSSELGATPEQIEKKIQVLNSLYSAYNRLKNAILGLEKTKNEQATIQQIY
jgi:hypothetical protein